MDGLGGEYIDRETVERLHACLVLNRRVGRLMSSKAIGSLSPEKQFQFREAFRGQCDFGEVPRWARELALVAEAEMACRVQ